MGPPYVTQSGQELGIILPQLPGTRKHTWLVLSPFLENLDLSPHTPEKVCGINPQGFCVHSDCQKPNELCALYCPPQKCRYKDLNKKIQASSTKETAWHKLWLPLVYL